MAPSSKPPEATWPHSVAGGVAGSATVLFLHPFDVIKTRLQVQDGHQRQQLAYKGALDAIRRTYQVEGWRAFYNGLVPAWVGSGVAWSAYFTVYESIKGFHQQWQGVERLSTQWHSVSAAEAGAVVCLLTNPVWLIKTRMQLQQHLPAAAGAAAAGAAAHSAEASQYRGFVDALVKIGRQEGLRGYYKGLGPSLVLQTTHGSVQFTVYEELKHLAARYGRGQASEPDRPISSLETTVFAAASKLAASVATYPSQVVRSRLQQQGEGRSLRYGSSWQVVRLTWLHEGVRGFYKGLGPALLRVMPQSAVTLVVYERVLGLIRGSQAPQG